MNGHQTSSLKLAWKQDKRFKHTKNEWRRLKRAYNMLPSKERAVLTFKGV